MGQTLNDDMMMNVLTTDSRGDLKSSFCTFENLRVYIKNPHLRSRWVMSACMEKTVRGKEKEPRDCDIFTFYQDIASC